ncbi:hypothetical protein ZOSMA_324G00150 [Zostera marina]|uniref:Uncharacterized protein n=1 Tax=Zostera marina TaxID=29655 RepID=A0A0K9P8L8_ZOSMR|nr:hypothetical protein ZOSMA_324G00150 [Zostera marina]
MTTSLIDLITLDLILIIKKYFFKKPLIPVFSVILISSLHHSQPFILKAKPNSPLRDIFEQPIVGYFSSTSQ